MFSLLLAILISSVTQVSKAAPGLQTSLRFGPSYDGIYQSYGYGIPSSVYGTQPYSYGTPNYIHSPTKSYSSYYRYKGFPEDVYIPGRPNPFNFPYYSSSESSFDPAQTKDISVISSKNARSPQTVFYEPIQSITDAFYPQYRVNRFYSEPLHENIESYTANGNLKASEEEYKGNYDSESGIQMGLNNNTSFNRSSDGYNNEFSQSLIDNKGASGISSEQSTGNEIQMTYLGFVPISSFRKTPQNAAYRQFNPSVEPHYGTPFYPLKYNYKKPNSLRSSSPPPILFSPYRFKAVPPSQGIYSTYSPKNVGSSRMIISLYSSNAHPAASRGTDISITTPPTTSVFSPYRSNPVIETAKGLNTSPSPSSSHHSPEFLSTQSQNGYYLIDFQPIVKSTHEPDYYSYEPSNSPMLGLVKPLLPLMPLKPKSKLIQTNTHTKTGIFEEGKKFNQFEHLNYNTGFKTFLPRGHIYSKLQKDNKKGGHTFHSGRGLKKFGSPELELLLGRLVMFRNARVPLHFN